MLQGITYDVTHHCRFFVSTLDDRRDKCKEDDEEEESGESDCEDDARSETSCNENIREG